MEIRQVRTSKDWSAFIDLPWTIYKGDNNWVPPLKIAVKDLLDVKKNPFFKHSIMLPLIAVEGGRTVGRIVGVIDERHNDFHKEKTAFFGFFEAVDDPKVAKALADAVVVWAKSRGMETLRGPMNPSTNHECGLLVEGFDDPPTVMMTYNPPYYGKLLEACGLVKSKDMFAYRIRGSSQFSDRLLRHAERIRESGNVTFRPIRMKDFDREVELLLEIYNDAWERNWGFVPMDDEEFKHLAKDMKAIVDPNLVLVAEVRGEVAGFALTLPDVNQAIHKIKDGKLFPTGLVKLLWNAKGPGKKKTITRCRIVTLGIRKKFQEAGLGPLFYTEYWRRGPQMGYHQGEASWILEDNKPMTRALEMMKSERYKTYRIYDRSLNA